MFLVEAQAARTVSWMHLAVSVDQAVFVSV